MPDSENTAHDKYVSASTETESVSGQRVCDQGLAWQLEGGLQNGMEPLPGGRGTHCKVDYDGHGQ